MNKASALPAQEGARSLVGADGHQLALFPDRIEFQSSSGPGSRWGSIPLTAVTGVAIESRERDRGLLIWGILGLIAAFGIWRVASNPNVSLLGSLAVAAISGVLLIQYYFRSPGLQLVVQAGTSGKGIPIGNSDVASAREFALALLAARENLVSRPAGPPARLPRYPIA